MKRILAIDTLNKVGEKVKLSGWVNTIRAHGKIVFIDLRDRSSLIQTVGTKDIFDEINPEDVISVYGVVKKRPEKMVNRDLDTGFVEIEVEKVDILSKAKTLPFDTGAKDLNLELTTLLDHRTLSLRHNKIKAIFKVQETIVATFRRTMKQLGFTEFQAPTIVATATEGGAQIFPVSYFNHTAYLAQSPQFYKQIMVSVFERVFTVAHAYRAEPSITTRHMTEYIGLDVEFGFIEDWLELMDTASYLLKNIFSSLEKENKRELDLYQVTLPKISDKIPRLKLKEAQEIIYKTSKRDIRKEPDLDPEGEKEIWRWAQKNYDSDLIFITHYPTKKRPMYTFAEPGDPDYTQSFDLIGCGQEWMTGGRRINNYDQLVSNIKKWGLNPKNFETPYLEAFKYGMPPEGGFCLGLERVTMNVMNLKNIREATAFPRDMDRIDVRFSKND